MLRHASDLSRPAAGAARAVLLSLLAATTSLVLVSGPAAATTDTVSGGAYGVEATLLPLLGTLLGGLTRVGPTPTVTLPADGATAAATGPSRTVAGVLSTDTMSVSTGATDPGTANEVVTSTATVDGVNGKGTLDVLSSGTVHTTCTSAADGSTGSTTVTALTIDGDKVTLPSTLPPNYSLPSSDLGGLAGVVTVMLNVQTVSDAVGSTAITVYGLRVTALSALLGAGKGTVVNLAEVQCGAAGPDIGQPPTVSSISPSSGPAAGDNTVTITGTNLGGTTGVDFGSAPASRVTVVSPTEVTVAAPAGSPGVVDVTVTTPFGTSTNVAGDRYTYLAAPTLATINGISPSSGPAAGGTSVTLTGTGFVAPATVQFGTAAATSVVVVSTTEVTADSPPGAAGSVTVTVTDGGGTSNGEPFTYVATASTPTITAVGGISPSSGPAAGGTAVTITGSHFATPATVHFGTAAATSVDVKSSTEITADSPPGAAGQVEVTVSGTGGTSNGEPFTYVATANTPTISADGISPSSGPTGGGTSVTLTGSHFVSPATVHFGSVTATSVDVVSSTEITADSPPGAAGQVEVTVSGTGGTSNGEPFTYVAAPSLSGVTPSNGTVGGGTRVTLSGTGFAAPATVDFGSAAATTVDVVSSGEITALSPAGSVGQVEVTVTDGGGTSHGEPFTYQATRATTTAVPGVSGITPTSGTPAGGGTVEIVGTGLCGVTAVDFGPNPATHLTADSGCTTLTVTVPAGSGTVPVVVTNAAGSATAPVGYTYIAPGYWMTGADGGIFSYGGAQFYGSMGGQPLNQPIVAMADTPDHRGYWLFAADGGVFAFGDAQFYGSVPGVLAPEGRTLNAPIVAAEATPDGRGYRLFAADGGVFDFGDAQFVGSLPGEGVTPVQPITGGVSTPVGQGYWLVARDGGVFALGNAAFYGSLGGGSGRTVVSMAATTTGHGYWIFSAGGGVAAFGDATDDGAVTDLPLSAPVACGAATTTDGGYWLFARDGGVFAFGDAPFLGSMGDARLNAPVVTGVGF